MLEEKIYRIQNYYKSKSKNALFILIWGLLTAAFGYYAYTKSAAPFWEGITYPTLLLALVQIVQGAYMLWQATAPKTDLITALQAGKTQVIPTEIAATDKRLEHMRRRNILQQVLIGLGIGFTLTAVFANLSDFMIGSGLGLMTQTAISYIADVLLRWRTSLYAAELRVERKDF